MKKIYLSKINSGMLVVPSVRDERYDMIDGELVFLKPQPLPRGDFDEAPF